MERFLVRRLACSKLSARSWSVKFARNTPVLFSRELTPCRVCQINIGDGLHYSTTKGNDAKSSSSDAVDEEKTCIEQEAEEKERTRRSEDQIKSKILYHALDHVIELGWSRKAISLGAEDAGYAGVAEGMFANEGADLVMYFVKESNEKLLRYMQENVADYKNSDGRLDVTAFIQDAVQYRLSLIVPFIKVWPEAMMLLLSPKILSESVNELGHMVDDVWYLAGDQSSDFNWYTKRALLVKLYTSTQLYMINDQSSDFTDTWQFLDRRMTDLKTFTRVARTFQQTCDGVYDASEASFNILRNAVGLPQRNR